MILRVYAMWNQSKKILYTLLFMFVLQVIVSIVFHGIYNNPNTYLSGMSQTKLQANLESHMLPPYLLPTFPPVTVVQVIDFSFCSISFSNASHSQQMLGTGALRFVFSVVLLILAVISTVKQSVVMYQATKQWQPNHYMQLFMKDGIFYFIAYVSSFPLHIQFHSLPSHSPFHLSFKPCKTH
jgi:hypothetical protein